MNKLLIYFVLFFYLFGLEVKANDTFPYKAELEEVFNVGTMLSHDDKFTLYFKAREKAVLAKGEEFNYITDYPQDLYIFYLKRHGKHSFYYEKFNIHPAGLIRIIFICLHQARLLLY